MKTLNVLVLMSTAHDYLFLRDEIAFCLGFYGLLRRSEIIALKVSDVCIKNLPGGEIYIEVTIRKSKTDQRGHGAHVCLAPITRHNINLLTRFQAWLASGSAVHSSPSSALLPSFGLSSLHKATVGPRKLPCQVTRKTLRETFFACGGKCRRIAKRLEPLNAAAGG